MGNRSPGYAGPKRHGFSSAFTEPARGKTLDEVTEPCPTCGQLCTLDTYETTINDQRYRVTVFHCPSEKSRRSKNPKIQAQACPRYQRKEKIDVPVLTTSEAAEIRQKAETAGLKIVDLSRRAGMGGSTLGNVLAGRQKIQEAALERVHDVLATAGGGATVGKQVPSFAKDLLKMHPDNRDRVLGPIAEQALPHYNGCPPANSAQDLARIEAIESRLGHAIKGSESVVREFSSRLTAAESEINGLAKSHEAYGADLTAIDERISNVIEDGNTYEERLTKLEERATQRGEWIQDRLNQMCDEIRSGTLCARGMDIEYFRNFDNRLDQLRADVDLLGSATMDGIGESLKGLDREFRKLVGTVTGIDNNMVNAHNRITELAGTTRGSDEAFLTQRINRMGEMIASQAETSRGNVEIIERLVQAVRGHSERLNDLEINNPQTIWDKEIADRIAALEAVASVHCSHRATLSDPNGDHVLWRELRRLNGVLESVQERLHDQAESLSEADSRAEFLALAVQAQAARLAILESRPAKNPALVRHFERVATAVAEQDPGQFAAVVERLLGVSHG